MNENELKLKLALHSKWLQDYMGGERANLRGADLLWADLRGADLLWADLRGANLRWADLREADLRGANLRDADLREADLRDADLRGANLREANLDFSSGLPFSCKTFGIRADVRLAAQIAYHFCKVDFEGCDEAKQAQVALKDLANKFHRVEECGEIV